jgi:transcriptional/translational regulatory protein YebC/TACO1
MRTVANIRSYFTKFGGTLGTQGSLQFLFDRKACFTVSMKEGIDLEELELELIDFGVEELGIDEEENTIVIYSDFNEAINMQKYLEENGFEVHSCEFVRIPNDTKQLTDEQRESVQKLIDRIEEDEDVQNVFTNLAD